ncbi:Maf family protein [Suttonella ornithocola]|uniref:dTTP/UTP pyrophosphatase n=1 Tax=Suttonella ornithocola TaxID=279832 RepID=A0A380MUG1_9GAMM|nr:Maf family protein [Suttonella ornithocola]SUO96249.1 Maf-like protein yhdE [Suttonella ornithocola]
MSLILASASPRRSQLLTQVGIAHQMIPANIDETPRLNETPIESVARFSHEKAAAIAARYPHDIILAADTIGILNGQLLGKPKDAAHAMEMLLQMSGKWHEVVTAFTVQAQAEIISQTVITKVRIRPADKKLLAAYIDTGEPLDKAGSYGIQGAGALLVEEIQGDYSAVVGLPLITVVNVLHRFGIMPFTAR